ncbi:MAG: hypothetical protein HQ534_01245 [Armatimonadetes bacterium]|nr:hypothetical protein [Armatimonadota bacterium]
MRSIILSALFLALLTSCSNKKQEAEWTILVYMAADNGLNNHAIEDMQEMESAMFSDEINVIVQIDYSGLNPESGAFRYHIYPEEKKLISSLGEIDSGDHDVLTEFANWGFNKYPSKKKSLIIWSHGNGWYPINRDLPPCFCPDAESENYISIPEKDFQNAMKNIDSHLDILILDACNMQTIEVITEIYEYTDFIIAAEDAIDTKGFPYHSILSNWENYSSVQNLAMEIAYYFHEFYWLEEIFPISCSVVKTLLFQNLLADVSFFTENWSENASDDIFHLSRQDCIEFNGSWEYLAQDVDIKEFFLSVLEHQPPDSLAEFCDRIVTTIDSCFIFQKTDEYPTGYTTDKVGTGIIWFPDEQTQGYFINRLEEYNQLDFANTNWQIFLENTFSR